MGLLFEEFYGVIFFGKEGWGGFTLNFMLYSKPVTNNRVSFFLSSANEQVSAGLKLTVIG